MTTVTRWAPKPAKLIRGRPEGERGRDGVAVRFEVFECDHPDEYPPEDLEIYDRWGSNAMNLYLRANGELAVCGDHAVACREADPWFTMEKRSALAALRAALRGRRVGRDAVKRRDLGDRGGPELCPLTIGRRKGIVIVPPCGQAYFVPLVTARSMAELIPKLKVLPWLERRR